MPLQAQSLRFRSLYLFAEGVHLLIHSRALGLRRIGRTQFFQRFFDGEFRCFSHDESSCPGDRRSDDGVGPPVEIEEAARGTQGDHTAGNLLESTQTPVDLDQRELRSGDLS